MWSSSLRCFSAYYSVWIYTSLNGRKSILMWLLSEPRTTICAGGSVAQVYIHVYTYTYMHVYVYMYMHICIYVYMYICIYVYMHICIYVYMYICIYVYMYICIYVYMYICIYVYMYICIYVYMYVDEMRWMCICIIYGYSCKRI